ncbi:MAG: helix-turn-helix transcriptional regulator [Cyanobacteria bacterium]|nr:helix-turn-helix transcriptional regulator [Cyanobacteriota bacterium]MDA1021010.1 helix-turn-helix transcriptional regulator [Cyanobacteriota bacterium]
MERIIQQYWSKVVTKIKAKRKVENITQKDLSAVTGISSQTISRLEQSDENIQLSTILGICDSLRLRLDIQEPYSFRLMIFKILVDGVKQDPYFFSAMLHNCDPGHPVYAFGSKGDQYSFPQDDNENKNPVFQFMKSVSENMLEYEELWEKYPPITTWQEFCELIYTSYKNKYQERFRV